MKARSLEGKGARPEDPYVRIMWASKKNVGITLSAEEVHDLSFDDAIATVAYGVFDDPPPIGFKPSRFISDPSQPHNTKQPEE